MTANNPQIVTNRQACSDCPQQHEPVCCHDTIPTDNKEDNRRANSERPFTVVWGTLVAKPWEQE